MSDADTFSEVGPFSVIEFTFYRILVIINTYKAQTKRLRCRN